MSVVSCGLLVLCFANSSASYLVLFLLTITTLLFAPGKGWLAIRARNLANKKQMAQENLLKTIEQLREKGETKITLQSILEQRRLESFLFEKTLNQLHRKKLLILKGFEVELTTKGIQEAQRIVRLHRLWEMYLTARLNFKNDHIHGTAETIEHLITEDLEKVLIEELNFPTEDPHHQPIPYGTDK